MADDPRKEPDDKPEAKQTKQLDKSEIMQAQLTQVLARLGDGFGKVDTLVLDVSRLSTDVVRLTGTVDLVSNDLGIVKDRVTILEAERTKLSGGVRGLSTSNAEQDAQLAQERAAREALATEVKALTTMQETQLAILGRLDKVASNPVVKTVVTILGTAFATWAASKGLK